MGKKVMQVIDHCTIYFLIAGTYTVIVLSAIDNLVKGAAGQAVQNFNIACGFDEKTGLDYVPMYP